MKRIPTPISVLVFHFLFVAFAVLAAFLRFSPVLANGHSGFGWFHRMFSVTLERLSDKKKNEMVLTIISIWLGAIAIGLYGAASALSNRWVRALAVIVVAGMYSISLLTSLKGQWAATLFQAGDVFVWLTMLSPVVMWILLGAGTSIAMWRQRNRLAAT